MAKAKKSAKKSGKSTKYVYTWGAGKADGNGSMKPLLGGKGANLAEMSRIGLPVPPRFTLTTEVCTYFYDHHQQIVAKMQDVAADSGAMRSAGNLSRSALLKRRNRGNNHEEST